LSGLRTRPSASPRKNAGDPGVPQRLQAQRRAPPSGFCKLAAAEGARVRKFTGGERNGGLGGPIVYVRYLDHVLFKDMDPAACSEPFVRGTVGRLASENERAIQVIWERQAGYVKYFQRFLSRIHRAERAGNSTGA
jgi:hypothetical protein